jgi:hypothetical protein
VARGDAGFNKAKAAAAKAAKDDADEQEALRKKMESGKRKPPAKLSRREMELARRMDDGSGGEVKPKKRFGR